MSESININAKDQKAIFIPHYDKRKNYNIETLGSSMDINLYQINKAEKADEKTNVNSSVAKKNGVKRCSSVQKTMGDMVDVYNFEKKKQNLFLKNSKKEEKLELIGIGEYMEAVNKKKCDIEEVSIN